MPQEFNPVAAVDVPVLVGKIKAEITQAAMSHLEQAITVNALGECRLGETENERSETQLRNSFPFQVRQLLFEGNHQDRTG